MILYYRGANLYQCGKPWLRTTIAYVSDAPLVEWVIACLYCVFVACSTYFIMKIRHRHLNMKIRHRHLNSKNEESGIFKEKVTYGQWLLAVTLFFPCLCLLSTFTIIDAISNSLPPDDNSVRLSSGLLTVSQLLVGPALYLIKAYALPAVANMALHIAVGSTDGLELHAIQFVVLARSFLTFVVPAAVAFLVSQNCMGYWHEMWMPCANASIFDESSIIREGGGIIVFPILYGSEICGSDYRFIIIIIIQPLIHFELSVLY